MNSYKNTNSNKNKLWLYLQIITASNVLPTTGSKLVCKLLMKHMAPF